ncbi:RNA polymerase sigma factor [Clostridium sp. Marseille-P2415]|uniref:RNA polymerase sigma factor n=1 Tax=Clostridium sp. Marseille-P2415 TaxID=1805471 RepID=UPI0013566194|nr:sigma-70 family RNA polymerase sigma factor [Clostridium sp. Marseille-P2415]
MQKREKTEETLELLKDYILSEQNKFYRVAYSYTKNSDDAADVVQEAICKAIAKVNTLKNTEYLKTWFYRILINEGLNYTRRNKKPVLNDEILANIGYEDKDVLQSYSVFQAVYELEPKLRTVIILRYYEDLKFTDIASITKSNLNTVKSRLYKALKLLKISIGGDELE